MVLFFFLVDVLVYVEVKVTNTQQPQAKCWHTVSIHAHVFLILSLTIIPHRQI